MGKKGGGGRKKKEGKEKDMQETQAWAKKRRKKQQNENKARKKRTTEPIYKKKNTRNVSLLSVLLVIRSPSSSLGEVCSERAGHSTSVAFSTPDKKRQRVGNTQRHGPQQRVFSEKGGVEE